MTHDTEVANTPAHRVRRRGRRGMVTAELAVGILAMALALLAASATIGLLILQDTAETIAAQAARQAARGDTQQLERIKKRAPRGAVVSIVEGEGWVVASVKVQRRWGVVGPITLEADAQAAKEPGQ